MTSPPISEKARIDPAWQLAKQIDCMPAERSVVFIREALTAERNRALDEVAAALAHKAAEHSDLAAEMRDEHIELARTHKSIAHTTHCDAELVRALKVKPQTKEGGR